MVKLNFPETPLQIKKTAHRLMVHDPVRRKYVVLTPEEWTRQHLVHYLHHHLGYPAGLTALEYPVKVFGLNQRADVVVFTPARIPLLIAECKAPHIPITAEVFQQALRYNMVLGVAYVLITNGLQHYCARVYPNGNHRMMADIPSYPTNGVPED